MRPPSDSAAGKVVEYKVRGKKRRPRYVTVTSDGVGDVTSGESASEAAGSERSEGNPSGKRARRGREGSGEGSEAQPVQYQGEEPLPPW